MLKVIGYGSCSWKHKAGNRRKRVTQQECRVVKQGSHAPWYCHVMTSTKYAVATCSKACQSASICGPYNYSGRTDIKAACVIVLI